jgi:hypothetical protein
MCAIEADKRLSAETSKGLKLETFNRTLQKMPPLMRHLFWKRQKIPSLWFDMRLNYSRSVATTSMIGHVLGLGDRHVSNILIDEATGELVHIDFGIAFEQVSHRSPLLAFEDSAMLTISLLLSRYRANDLRSQNWYRSDSPKISSTVSARAESTVFSDVALKKRSESCENVPIFS